MTDTKTHQTNAPKGKDTLTRATEELEANPLAVLVGGLAVGALAGALLPRSAREKELLAPVGKRLGETAARALSAAKDAGQQELDSAGLTKGAAKDRGRDVLDGLTKALSSAGSAAVQSARKGDAAPSSPTSANTNAAPNA